MEDIIKFLIQVELTASNVYKDCALYFSHDKQFNTFLHSLVDDEISHYNFMNTALKSLSEINTTIKSDIIVDQETVKNIVEPLTECQKLLKKTTLDKEYFLENLVRSEYSEWNNIFIYVIEKLKVFKPSFQFVASRIQAHYRRLRQFIETQDNAPRLLKIIDKSPTIWERNLLIAEDDPMLCNLLSMLFSSECKVDTAQDGKTALEKAEFTYYDMILSDIDMPNIDGFSFYKKLIKKKPEQKTYFAFMSGDLDDERMRFIEKAGISAYSKPFKIDMIKASILNAMDK